jgi:hypothetical protein
MQAKAKGSRAERRAMRLLEASGYIWHPCRRTSVGSAGGFRTGAGRR